MGKATKKKHSRRHAVKMSEEVIRREVSRAAAAVGIDPALIYAMNKTRMLVAAGNTDQWSDEDLAAWNAAIEEYHSLISKSPS